MKKAEAEDYRKWTVNKTIISAPTKSSNLYTTHVVLRTAHTTQQKRTQPNTKIKHYKMRIMHGCLNFKWKTLKFILKILVVPFAISVSTVHKMVNFVKENRKYYNEISISIIFGLILFLNWVLSHFGIFFIII